MWKMPCMWLTLRKCSAMRVSFHMGAFGALSPKPTVWPGYACLSSAYAVYMQTHTLPI